MRALDFLVWLRDIGVVRHSKEGDKLKPPSNSELRRWIKNGAIRCNGTVLLLESVVEWPIVDLVLFSGNEKARCTIV